MHLRLTLRSKLVAIVLSTSLAFLVVIIASTAVTQHIQEQLVRIEQHHIPKLEIGPLIEADFAALPRSYRDAVAAHDLEALERTREIRDRILERISNGSGAVVLDQSASVAFRAALSDYHDTAIAVSRRMLTDESGEALVDATREMQRKQAHAHDLLERLVAFDQEDLTTAFRASREALQAGALARLAVSAGSLIVVLTLSIWLMRGLVRSLEGIHAGFTRFGKGWLDDPIPVIGTDELADVARQANRMAKNLAEIDMVKTKLLDETQDQANRLLSQEEELRSTNEQLVTQQEELRQTNAELAEYSRELAAQRLALQARNIDLQDAGRRLEQKAAELATVSVYKSQFLTNMSHELRTPLNSMLLLSNLLAENGDGNLTSKQVEYARTVNVAGRDLLTLINQVLDLAKVEAGKQDVHIAPTSLREIVTHIERVFSPLAKEKSVHFIVEEIAEGLPDSIAIDRQRVGQILLNLVGNAIKFTPKDGEVKLRIERPATTTKFRSSTRRPEATVAFAVSDTGAGIAPEDQQRVFAPFEQAMIVGDPRTSASLPSAFRVGGKSTLGGGGGGGIGRRSTPSMGAMMMQRGHGGTGLGLSIARELATLLGGEIHLHSVLGRGSTFTLYLPATIATAASTENHIPVPPPITHQLAPDSAHPKTSPPPAGKLSDDLHVYILETDLDPHRSIAAFPIVNDVRLEGKKLLVVDDDMRTVYALSATLRAKGADVLVGETGAAALTVLAEHPDVDAVLMDVMMPEMDGYEATRRIRAQSRFAHLPIIALTAKAMNGDEETCRAAGASDYLPKPIDADVLVALLHRRIVVPTSPTPVTTEPEKKS